jgi:hypothetical protein
MATGRSAGTSSYNVGSAPPEIVWTVVRGDTASFKAYVTTDELEPLFIPDWTIEMDIKRGDLVVATLYPTAIPDNTTPSPTDKIPGEFLVSLTATQCDLLRTGDVFDIQMTNTTLNQVWTVAQGSFVIIQDITR